MAILAISRLLRVGLCFQRRLLSLDGESTGFLHFHHLEIIMAKFRINAKK
jgi:hypothetical protein